MAFAVPQGYPSGSGLLVRNFEYVGASRVPRVEAPLVSNWLKAWLKETMGTTSNKMMDSMLEVEFASGRLRWEGDVGPFFP